MKTERPCHFVNSRHTSRIGLLNFRRSTSAPKVKDTGKLIMILGYVSREYSIEAKATITTNTMIIRVLDIPLHAPSMIPAPCALFDFGS